MKKVLAVLSILLLAAFVAGCAEKEEPKATPEATPVPEQTPAYKLVKPGVLTVGMDATYPPFE